MKKLPPYKQLHRTTIGDLQESTEQLAGVYIIAYLGKVIYVGKTHNDVKQRLIDHTYDRSKTGYWLLSVMDDWYNVRIDILEPVDISDDQWLADAERACIRKFTPLFNYQHNPKYTDFDGEASLYYQKHNPVKQLDLPMSVP